MKTLIKFIVLIFSISLIPIKFEFGSPTNIHKNIWSKWKRQIIYSPLFDIILITYLGSLNVKVRTSSIILKILNHRNRRNINTLLKYLYESVRHESINDNFLPFIWKA